MERIATVTISGKTYKLTNSAYKLLTDYDNFIKSRINDKEKIADIETQMAALIDTDISDEDQVVDESIIKEAISLIGENENIRYSPEVKKTYSKKKYKTSGSTYKKNKVYRDTERSVLGGVCAGFGNYFNIDPVIIRVIAIISLFVFGFTFLAYIIMWIVLPDKKNAALRENSRMYVEKD